MSMMNIVCRTGSEWHSSRNCKGYVFVVNGGEKHIYESDAAKLVRAEPWELVGNKGKHGKWRQASYAVDEGAILKFFSTGSDKTAGGYFRLSSSAPLIKVMGATYNGDGAWLEGQLLWVSPANFEIDARWVHHYDEENLSIEKLASV